MKFKEDIKTELMGNPEFANSEQLSKIVSFVFDYPRFSISKEDLEKRMRLKNSIPVDNRCIAKRANDEQCTRRRKEGCEYCGTHSKGTPHGVFNEHDNSIVQTQKVDVFAVEIKGIVYYVDAHTNVYKTEDILENKENPQIIAKWTKVGTTYTIPQFNI